jgi:lysophospholipid acyltransferase (LPLAT)-like uncharacterized protein
MNKLGRTLLVWLLYLFVQLLRSTYRIDVVGGMHRQAAQRAHAQGSFALALWHEYLFASIVAHAGQRFAPLASLSGDGELVARVMDKIGFSTVRGSSSRGGPEARDRLVEAVADGFFTAITVDGPRGPRRRVKGGIIDVARRTQVAVLPLQAVADREWVLHRSWDQFKIPKPFARIVVAYGEPLTVPAATQGLAFGEAKALLKQRLETLELAARAALR